MLNNMLRIFNSIVHINGKFKTQTQLKSNPDQISMIPHLSLNGTDGTTEKGN